MSESKSKDPSARSGNRKLTPGKVIGAGALAVGLTFVGMNAKVSPDMGNSNPSTSGKPLDNLDQSPAYNRALGANLELSAEQADTSLQKLAEHYASKLIELADSKQFQTYSNSGTNNQGAVFVEFDMPVDTDLDTRATRQVFARFAPGANKDGSLDMSALEQFSFREVTDDDYDEATATDYVTDINLLKRDDGRWSLDIGSSDGKDGSIHSLSYNSSEHSKPMTSEKLAYVDQFTQVQFDKFLANAPVTLNQPLQYAD